MDETQDARFVISHQIIIGEMVTLQLDGATDPVIVAREVRAALWKPWYRDAIPAWLVLVLCTIFLLAMLAEILYPLGL